MANINVTFDTSRLRQKLQASRQVPLDAMPMIYKEFKQLTPIAELNGGNARRETRLEGRTIHAEYPYASVLDQGRGFRDGQMRGSEQAPQGMSKPTLDFIKQRIKQILGGK